MDIYDYDLFFILSEDAILKEGDLIWPNHSIIFETSIKDLPYSDPPMKLTRRYSAHKSQFALHITRERYNVDEGQFKDVVLLVIAFFRRLEITKAELEIFTDSKSTFYQIHTPNEYQEFSGRIPIQALRRTESISISDQRIDFFKQKLEEGLIESDIEVNVNSEDQFIFSKK